MKATIKCPNGCIPKDLYGNPVDTPFVYDVTTCNVAEFADPQPDYELGVLAYPDATPSNRWEDGTAGVPKSLWDALNEWSENPSCIECGETAHTL